jgi:hypothetical protein
MTELSKLILFWILLVAVVFFGGRFVVNYLPTLANRVVVTATTAPIEVLIPETTVPAITPIFVVTATLPPPTTTASTVPVALESSDVTVLVLNSISRTGLAAGATADLAALGYNTEEPSNISPERALLEIYFVEGRELEAIALSDAMGGATLFLDTQQIVPADVDLVVVLGTDYER